MPAETAGLFADWPLSTEATPAQPAEAQEVGRDAPPRFKTIDRRQTFFRTVDVETLIDEEHPARAIWSVVERLDLSAFSEDARALEGCAGRSAIHPCLLASLWIYAYSQSVGSAREIPDCARTTRRTSGSPGPKKSVGTRFPTFGSSIRAPWRNCS